jgi:predicted nucleotidyltransferase
LRHYLHTAESNWKAYFDSDSVKLKKYFYVLRPIFACRWIEQHQTVPPVLFQSLLDGAGETGAVEAELEDLLLAKSQISELGVAPRRPILDKFLVQEMSRIRDLKMASFAPVDYQVLDEFFRWSLSRTDEQ